MNAQPGATDTSTEDADCRRRRRRAAQSAFAGFAIDSYSIYVVTTALLPALIYFQTSQVDGLRHIRHPEHGFYGGVADDRIDLGTPDLGMQLVAQKGTVGLDGMAGHFGVELRSGDILLLYTGFSEYWLGTTPEQRQSRTGSPGLDQSPEILAWLWDHQIPVAASDNGGLEAGPVNRASGWYDPDEPAPPRGPSNNGLMHRPLIALLGELWKLGELAEDCAADGRYEFLVTSKPLDLLGGVGSPPNAMAIK